ncbi:hypothetical protein Tco_0138317 [Tanacetum coccineum]
MHTTLPGPPLKKNIGLFSGFISDDDEVESLSFASEEVIVKLIDFLQSPNAMTEVMLAEKEHMESASSVADVIKNFVEDAKTKQLSHYEPMLMSCLIRNNHIMIEVGIIRASVNRQRVNAADNVIEEERESEYDDMQQDGRPNPNKTTRKIGDG